MAVRVYGDTDITPKGYVSNVDAIRISYYLVGKATFNEDQLKAADVDGDGKVTVKDAMFISQYLVGTLENKTVLARIGKPITIPVKKAFPWIIPIAVGGLLALIAIRRKK